MLLDAEILEENRSRSTIHGAWTRKIRAWTAVKTTVRALAPGLVLVMTVLGLAPAPAPATMVQALVLEQEQDRRAPLQNGDNVVVLGK